MKHWLDVFRYEFWQQLRRKSYLFITFVVPLLAIAAFYGYQLYRDMGQGGEDKPVDPITEELQNTSTTYGYVDRTPEGLFPDPAGYPEVDCALGTSGGAEQTRSELIKTLTSPYCMRQIVHYYPSFEAGKQALEDDDLDALYVIESDFATSGDISLYFTGFDIELASEKFFEDFVRASLLYSLDADTYEQVFLRLRDPAVITKHQVADTGTAETENEDQNFALVYGFGLLTMLSIFWGGGYLMQSVVQEKESQIVEIVISSVQPTALLLGKILAMGLLSVIQVGTLVGTFAFLGSQAGDVFSALGDLEIETGALVVTLVYFMLGFLLFGSLMAAIGAVSMSMRESQNFVVFVTLPAAIPFFFLTFFAEEPNSTLAVVLSMVPLTSPLSMVMRMAITNVAAGQIVLSLGLLLVGVGFAVWLAGRLFRVNILLSGKMPGLRDLPKLIRG